MPIKIRKTVILTILLILTVLFAFYTEWSNYLLAIILIIDLIFLFVLGFIALFKRPNSKIVTSCMWIGIFSAIGIFTTFFKPYKKAIIVTQNTSRNLEYAYKTDQGDRKKIKSYIDYFSELNKRDSIRLDQARNYYLKNNINEPIDKFYAAFIFHHSKNKKDFKIASELATEAASDEGLEDNYMVQWLKKATFDRYMLSIGEPEKYNTQNNFSLEIN